jgi:hypothetical protein
MFCALLLYMILNSLLDHYRRENGFSSSEAWLNHGKARNQTFQVWGSTGWIRHALHVHFCPPHQLFMYFMNWSNEVIILASFGSEFHTCDASYLKALLPLGKHLNRLGKLTIYYAFIMSNFSYSYMTMSRLTYILGFSVNFFLQPIYTDYTNTRFSLIWFSGFRGKYLNVIFYQNMPNLHNRYKSAERKSK